MWNSNIFEEYKTSALIKIDMLENPESMKIEKGEYQCRKCKNRRVRTTTAQLRSGDEGMSVLCICVVCGNQWRES